MVIKNVSLETVCGITSKIPDNPYIEFAFAGFVEIIANGNRYIAKINIDWARFNATVAHSAMVAHIVEFIKMFHRHAAPRLFFV